MAGGAAGRRPSAKLTDAIGNLHEDTQFAIVVFNGEVDVWQRKLVPANEANKEAAIAYVQSQTARSSTASYDASGDGVLVRRRGHLLFVRRRADQRQVCRTGRHRQRHLDRTTAARRESIYTIGIAPGLADGPMEWFMKTLADQNLGLYRRVDE